MASTTFVPATRVAGKRFQLENLETRRLLAAAVMELPTIVAPTSNPTLPSGFDVFTPQASASSSAAGAPQIAQYTQSGNAGDVIAVSLTNPSALPASDNDSDTQFFTYGQTTTANGTLVGDGIEQIGGGIASVDLNTTNPANSMYFLWTKNNDGYSAPVAINKADAWWVGPNQATAGQSISVYGQNLTFSATDGLSWVYLTQAGSTTGQWATVSSANPYQVTFTVPTGLAAGNYQVWVHNGHGGEYGWSSPVTLDVVAPAAASNKIFNVLDYGAVTDGKTDSTAAFQAAINAASAYPGATVYAPTGTYVVSRITMQPGLTLLGDGAGKTNILESASANVQEMLWFNSNDQIQNLTLISNNSTLQHLAYGRFVSNVHFDNVNMTDMTVGDFDIHGSSLIFFSNCNFTGTSSFLGTASQLFFDHDNFYAVDDAEQMLFSYGGNDISITNCTVQNYDDSNPDSGAGWGQGRFFVGNNLWGDETNTYIAGNTTIGLGVRPTFSNQNCGEQLLWESTGLVTGGTYVSSTANTVTYTGLGTSIGPNDYAIIVSGDGTGEYVPIQSYNATTGVITLAGSWAATPDSTSVVRVGLIFNDIAVYDNTLQGQGVTATASAGVQFWGDALNCVVDSNNISNTRYGVNIIATQTSGNIVPSYFNLVQNNVISNVEAGIWIAGNASSTLDGTAGSVYRFNKITNVTAGMGGLFVMDYGPANVPFFVVLEGNSVTSAPVALSLPSYVTGEVSLTLIGNTLTLGSATAAGSIGLNLSEASALTQSQNTISGFAQDQAGTIAPTTISAIAAPTVSQAGVITNGSSSSTGSGSTGTSGTTKSGKKKKITQSNGVAVAATTPDKKKSTPITDTINTDAQLLAT